MKSKQSKGAVKAELKKATRDVDANQMEQINGVGQGKGWRGRSPAPQEPGEMIEPKGRHAKRKTTEKA
jgi:hypothetical protein